MGGGGLERPARFPVRGRQWFPVRGRQWFALMDHSWLTVMAPRVPCARSAMVAMSGFPPSGRGSGSAMVRARGTFFR